jgi:hypothetical protein
MARRTLPKKVEDWKAPWEVDADGNDLPEEDQKLDPARLKKLLHGLFSDKERALEQVDELRTQKDELETKVADAADPKALEKLQADLQQAKAEAEKAKSGGSLQALRYEIALEKGLTKSQARRLVGESREELEEDADELIKDLRPTRSSKDDDQGDDGDRLDPRRGPQTRHRNPVDPDPDADKGKKDPTPEEVFKAYQNRY